MEANYKWKKGNFIRFKIFESNFKLIQKHNAHNSDFKMGINQFSDMSP